MNITDEQLKKIFELASMSERAEKGNIEANDITEALIEIERKLYSFVSAAPSGSLEDKKVLIADDLELSIYQLTTILKRIGISPRIARHKDEAVSEIQKVKFDCIIIDLFMPDSSDGFALIEAAVNKKNESEKSLPKIVVISGTDDKKLVEMCYEKGIDLYIQKDKDWHSNLLKYIGSTFKTENSPAFTRFSVNGDIALYSVKKFNEERVFNSFVKDVNSALFTDIKHIVFDLRTVTEFDKDNAYIFADIFKIVAERNGAFILLNPSADIKEALSFAYLDGIIPVLTTTEEAVNYINKNFSDN